MEKAQHEAGRSVELLHTHLPQAIYSLPEESLMVGTLTDTKHKNTQPNPLSITPPSFKLYLR